MSPTDEVSKVLGGFSQLSIGGTVDFAAAVQIAQLALKHRRNKNGGQRIIVFVGSPIETDVKALEKVGKQLKKNNVSCQHGYASLQLGHEHFCALVFWFRLLLTL